MTIYDQTTQIPAASRRMNELVAMIRLYLRDYAPLNRLIEGEETNDRMIAWAIIDTLDDFNTTPPFIGKVGINNFPSLSLLREGAVVKILESTALLQTRNQINYSDGGISFSVSDKASFLLNWIQMFYQRYEQRKAKMKASINVELAMEGEGVLSEYFVINGLYFNNF